jgi:hypothetical protein
MYRLVYCIILLIVEYVRNSWYVQKNSVKWHFSVYMIIKE